MMNFATLQGLTIPEGVVTQIADAQGNVLWSSAPPFDGTIILRPSADISVDSNFTLVPSDATAAYMLINEEVSDGAATRIYINDSLVSSCIAIAKFSLSGNESAKITRVTNLSCVISAEGTTSSKEVSTQLAAYLVLNDIPYFAGGGSGSMLSNIFHGTNYEPLTFDMTYEPLMMTPDSIFSTYTDQLFLDDLCNEINTYVSANGSLPEMELWVSMLFEQPEDKDPQEINLSQIYIVIECE